MTLFRITVLAFGVGAFLYHISAPDEHSARQKAVSRAIHDAGAVAEFRISAVQVIESAA